MLKKNLISVATSLLFLSFLFTNSFAATSDTKVTLNGKKLNIKTKTIDNKVYVPLEDAFKSLGANVVKDKSNNYSVQLQGDDDRIPNILKKISKSVVGIIGDLKDDQSSTSDDKYVETIAHGTGVIIKSTGEILTNAHVVRDLDKIVVVLSDGTGYEATLKSIDEDADLALIKIPRTNLTPITFGSDKDIVIGRTVIAVGTPVSFSLMNSATSGIISGLNRGNDSYYKLIQTDASINPGNSGGPLISMDGKLIGINSSKYVGDGIEGIGFSIPINTINYVLKQFSSYGKVKRPNLGTEFEEDWIAKIGLPSSNGLKIVDVAENSSSAKAGLIANDVLISINNIRINTMVDLHEEMKKYSPGNEINIKYKRDNTYKTVNLKLE